MITPQEQVAFRRALQLAERGPQGANPRVGCVLLGPDQAVVGEGWHGGAGTAHAEVAALRDAGADARGATAVVTLEPCDHTGRTPPCTQALLAAGVTRVLYGCPDPDPRAAGGARTLAAAGVAAELISEAECSAAAWELLRPWARAHRHERPLVTWKWAATLDGRIAAADGTSRWVTGPAARRDVHRLRADHDTVLVGTGTALADDPALTMRDCPGEQPRRAVLGLRDLPASAQLLTGPNPALQLRTRDPQQAMSELWSAGTRRLLLEGGATVAGAFLRAGLVDDVVAYLAPRLFGSGLPAVADLGVTTLADAIQLRLHDVTVLDGDVRLTYRAVEGDTAPNHEPQEQ